ncbi:SET domain-containing protein [Trametes versicolor FP-101664 SS1]|uniref:SET domain-containing protein n=1 Tax=Trametes versicolor (strain FP-101664) TaxID=717944 RepID=UPI0004621F0D|nr:SET domain-containing protein [Trametes versicolor FP-101664 SS1]EIW62724.1 SET domain-containing protein [Trametes versicolor FP-101664 SS1]
MSGPRRSARLTSSSAGSSVEPPERPISRTRRTRAYIRTASDDAAAAHGGISRTAGNSFVQAFKDAGFEPISWKHDRKRIAKEFAPLTQFAKDIPHELHDRINALSLGARLAGNMQALVFEAEIHANTAEDEPYAPPIRIVNEIDDEPTPPVEFYYSNLMWHGEGVPKPDHDSLHGCDCFGPCDPTSTTCACVKRQRKYQWDQGGFIYDKKGKLRAHEYPIFECNMNCGCSEDCMNRVVQHGRQYEIAICKTLKKGWGVFNGPKKIPANSYIGIYAGEYLTDSEGEIRGTLYNKFGRTYLFDIDFWYLKDDEEKVKYCIDAYHAGNNHSCDPNCVIVACYINEGNLDKALLTIFTNRDVEPYEELCFSYFGTPDDDMGVDPPPDGDSDDDAVHVKCQCGAPNCTGRMWK